MGLPNAAEQLSQRKNCHWVGPRCREQVALGVGERDPADRGRVRGGAAGCALLAAAEGPAADVEHAESIAASASETQFITRKRGVSACERRFKGRNAVLWRFKVLH